MAKASKKPAPKAVKPAKAAKKESKAAKKEDLTGLKGLGKVTSTSGVIQMAQKRKEVADKKAKDQAAKDRLEAEREEQERLDAEEEEREEEEREAEKERERLENGNDDDDDDDDDDDPELTLSSQAVDRPVIPLGSEGRGADYDIFRDFGDKQAKQHPVYYYIKKNSQYQARKDHPYYLEDLQKEFGGGIYHIVAKHAGTNKALKHQTITVLGLPGQVPTSFQDVQAAAIASQGMSAKDVATLIREQNEQKTKELSDMIAKNSGGGGHDMILSMMMQQMNNSQQSMTLMISEISKSTAQASKEASERTERMIQAMSEQIKAVANKEPELKPLELFKMMQTEKSAGASEYAALVKSIKDQLEDKVDVAEAIKEAMASLKTPAIEKSMVDKILEGALPILAAKMAQMPAGGALPAPAAPGGQAQPAPAAQRPPAPPQPRPAPLSGQPPVQTAVKPGVGKTIPTTATKLGDPAAMKQSILDLLLPIVVDGLTKQSDPSDSASDAAKALVKANISRVEVVKNFTVADLVALRVKYGIPEVADVWLKDFFTQLTKAPAAAAPVAPTPA